MLLAGAAFKVIAGLANTITVIRGIASGIGAIATASKGVAPVLGSIAGGLRGLAGAGAAFLASPLGKVFSAAGVVLGTSSFYRSDQPELGRDQ